MSDNGEERLETPEEMAAQTGPSNQAPFASAKKLAKAKELLRSVAVAQGNAALYPPTHPLVTQGIEDVVAAVAALGESGFDQVTVNVYKGTLFVENQVFSEDSGACSSIRSSTSKPHPRRSRIISPGGIWNSTEPSSGQSILPSPK